MTGLSCGLNATPEKQEIHDHDGNLMASGFYPHVGRKFTMSENIRVQTSSIWRGNFLRHPQIEKVEVTRNADGALVQVRVRNMPALMKPTNSSRADIPCARVSRAGTIECSYDYTPVNARRSCCLKPVFQ